MPRNVSDIYYIPPGTEGFPDTTIESEKYNNYIHDVETDLNRPRPISAGGTGADDADEALANLHAEKAGQVVTNFDSHVWMAGSFYSTISATAPPVALHAFSGIAHITDANNMVVEAVDLTDPLHKSYIRVKTAGVWGAWEGVSIVTCADDPPTGNRGSDNALWWESSTGLLYIRYNDGDSSQWTIACPQPDISTYAIKTEVDASKVAKAGDTMTGDLVISNGGPSLLLNGTDDAALPEVTFQHVNINRWSNYVSTSPAADYNIGRYDNAGSLVGNALTASRSTGLITVAGDPTAALGIATKQYVDSYTGARFQRIAMAGLNQSDVAVPATAEIAKISGVLWTINANNCWLIVQISLSAGVFLNTVGDYSLDGTQLTSASATPLIYNNNQTQPGMLIGGGHTNASIPLLSNAIIPLTRTSTSSVFSCDTYGSSWNGVDVVHTLLHNYANIAVSGSALRVLALRFKNAGSADNFGPNSFINVEWL